MTDIPLTAAYFTVARQVAVAVLTNGRAEEMWEDFPDIGEHDWEQVLVALDVLVQDLRLATADSEAAYDLLTQRARVQAAEPADPEQIAMDWL